MKKRYRGLGYLFFGLITITSVIMIYSFARGLVGKATRSSDNLIPESSITQELLNTNPGDVLKQFGSDYNAAHDNFHYFPSVEMVDAKNRSACLFCHTPMPHNREIKHRAFLNMHTSYLACESCHYEYSEFSWMDMESMKKLSGKPPVKSKMRRFLIVPLVNGEVQFQKQSNTQFQELAQTKNFADRRNNTETRKAVEGNILTNPLDCLTCHKSEQTYLDLKSLGYDAEREKTLESLSIPSVFESYQEFFLPEL
jgi:hypothetical protein